MSLCTYDSDCPFPLVCYVNATWAIPLINALTNKGCLASTWYGNADSGGNFVESYQTPTNRWWIACGIIFSIGFFSIFSVCVINLLRLGRFSLLDYDSATTITIQIAISSVLLGTSQIFWLISAINYNVQTQFNEIGERESMYILHGYLLLTLGLLGVILCAATISLLWVEVATRAQRMDLTQVKNLSMFRNLVFVFEFAASLMLLIPVGLGKQVYAPIIAVVIQVILAGFYIVGMIRMTALISAGLSLAGNNENNVIAARYKQSLLEIRVIAFGVCFCLLMDVILGVSLSALTQEYGWKELTPPGNQVPVLLILYQVPPCMSVFILWILTLYLTRIISRRIHKASSSSLGGGGGGNNHDTSISDQQQLQNNGSSKRLQMKGSSNRPSNLTVTTGSTTTIAIVGSPTTTMSADG
jgi:hypothetical protein